MWRAAARGALWRRREQVNECSPSGSRSRPHAGRSPGGNGRDTASPEAWAGRFTGPGVGRRPAPALACVDLHLRGPEWRGKFACRPRCSCSSGGTEVLSRPRFPPAPSGAPLPVSAFGKRRCWSAYWESSRRADHVTHPNLAFRVPTRDKHLEECGTSVSPIGRSVCEAASSGGSFALESSASPAAPGCCGRSALDPQRAGDPKALGSAEVPQCPTPTPTNSDFVHCTHTDISSAPNLYRPDRWMAQEHVCMLCS